MKKLVISLVVLASFTAPMVADVVPVHAQIACDSTDHCYTKKKARRIWNHHRYTFKSATPVVKSWSVDGKTSTATKRGHSVQSSVSYIEWWAWGPVRAWTDYRKAVWYTANGHNLSVNINSWTHVHDFTFWDSTDEVQTFTSGSKKGTYYYNRQSRKMEECIFKFFGCRYLYPWIAMTLRGDGSYYVCGSDGDCYGREP